MSRKALSSLQLHTLRHLVDRGGSRHLFSLNDYGHNMNTVKSLERRGLVTISDVHRLVTITPAGRKALEDAKDAS